jgi:hypothetical protein
MSRSSVTQGNRLTYDLLQHLAGYLNTPLSSTCSSACGLRAYPTFIVSGKLGRGPAEQTVRHQRLSVWHYSDFVASTDSFIPKFSRFSTLMHLDLEHLIGKEKVKGKHDDNENNDFVCLHPMLRKMSSREHCAPRYGHLCNQQSGTTPTTLPYLVNITYQPLIPSSAFSALPPMLPSFW